VCPRNGCGKESGRGEEVKRRMGKGKDRKRREVEKEREGICFGLEPSPSTPPHPLNKTS